MPDGKPMLRSAIRDGAFIALKTFLMVTLSYEKIGWKSSESLLNLPPLGFDHPQETRLNFNSNSNGKR